MTHKKSNYWVILLLLLPLLACSLTGGGEEAASSQVSLGSEESAPAEEAAPQEVVEETEQMAEEQAAAEEAAGPAAGPFTAKHGFLDFDSFRANSVLEFEGGRGDVEGETTDGVQSYTLEVTRNPAARYMAMDIRNEGTVAADAQTEFYLVDGVTYTFSAGNWIAQQGKMGASQFSNPAVFAPLPDTATCDSDPVEVNGVSAIHCTFTIDDMSFSSLDAASSNGEVWVAEDGNYVVSYILEATDVAVKGAFEGSAMKYFDVYRTGYDLTDINGDISIELPAEAAGADVIDMAAMNAGGATSGLAVPPNAELIIDNEFVLMYFSADMTTEEIAAFHRDALSSAGWEELPDDSYVEEINALLAFAGEGGVLRVFASQDIDGGFFVNATMPFEMPDMSGDSAPAAPADSGGDSAGDSGSDSGNSAPPAAGGDLPLMADAADVLSMGGFTSYTSAGSIDAVLQFYRDQLPPLGWAEDENVSFSDDTTGMLMFNKDNQSLLLTLSAEGGSTTVGLVITDQ
ncbi:MAG: hypothetical protein Kow0031_23440 [Anaerolineae bacterium]